jgi:hypothetical protein
MSENHARQQVFFVTSHSTNSRHGPYESQADAEEAIAAPLIGDTEDWTIQAGTRTGMPSGVLRAVRTGRGPLEPE